MEDIVSKIKKDFTEKENRLLFFFCFIGALFVHGYEMFAKHPNYDEFISIFHYGGGYTLGRWMLSFIGNLIFKTDGLISLPWFNGLLFVFFISLSACLFTISLRISNHYIKVAACLLFVSFPSMTATLSYMFTAPYYGFSILLVAIAFYLTVNFRYGFIPSIALICASMGIYQAYFCLIACMFFIEAIKKFFENETEIKRIFISSFKYLTALIAGLLGYMIFNKIILNIKKVDLSSYQGISNMGRYSFSSILNAITLCYSKFFSYFHSNYVSVFPFKILNILLIVLWILTIVTYSLLIIKIFKTSKIKSILATIAFFLIPIAVNTIFIMCAESLDSIHALMCLPIVMMFIFPMIIIDLFISKENKEKLTPTKIILAGSGVILCLFAFIIYSKYANSCYMALELHYEQTYSFFNELKTRIQKAEGYQKDMPICFVGDYNDDSSLWPLKQADALAGSYQTQYIVNYGEARARLFETYLGFKYNEIPADDSITSSKEYSEMTNYPDWNAVKIVNDTVVVKFSDP